MSAVVGRTTAMLEQAIEYQKKNGGTVLVVGAVPSHASQMTVMWARLDDRGVATARGRVYLGETIIARIRPISEMSERAGFTNRPEVFVDHYVYEYLAEKGESLL